MEILITIFWGSLLLIFYAYLGYGLLLYLMVRFQRFRGKNHAKISAVPGAEELPEVTFVIAAYNEEDFIKEKIHNSLELTYPKGKIHFLFVTDGSTDKTMDIIRNYPQIKLMHSPERKGKIAAVHRVMPEVHTPIVIFTDANTMLNPEAAVNMVRHYQDPKVGAVAGEKRIMQKNADAASGAGEGIYWKYESALKRWDSELYSVVGAAGELFSIRKELYEAVPPDTVIEDFYMTLRIAQRGYRVVYEPEAYAIEGPSASVKEELKRKIRIAAGGIQAIIRLRALLNVFRYGKLSFQYISHRVLRWTLAPICLALVFITNLILASTAGGIYSILMVMQTIFYVLVLLGYITAQKQLKIKAFFIPYYFFIMNYAVYAGFIRYMRKSQSVVWEKAKRAA